MDVLDLAAMNNLDAAELEATLKDPTYRDGTTGEVVAMVDHMSWTPLTLVDQDTCEHLETACPDCVDDWASDYWLRFRASGHDWHGVNGTPGYPPIGAE